MSDEHDNGSDDADGEADGHHEPERETFSHDPIGHAEVRAGMAVGELADEYGNAGVGAADLHEAVDVTEAMFDDDVTVFFGLAGAMVPTGMRAIVADLIRDGYIDVLVTTGANLTHDSIEAIGGKHHHGAVHAEGKTEREHDETLRDGASTASTTSISHRSSSPTSRATCARRCFRCSRLNAKTGTSSRSSGSRRNSAGRTPR